MEEMYADHGYNVQSLQQAAHVVGSKGSMDVNKQTKDHEHDEGALMYTYVQVMDAYREGTIDNHVENSANGVDSIPREGYEGMQ